MKHYTERQEMAPQSEDMDRQIGILIGKMDLVQESLRRQEEKSDASRASMHRQIEAVTERVGKVEGYVATIQEDVARMEPTVERVKAMEQRGLGVLAVVGIAASFLTFLTTQYFGDIVSWLVKR